MSYRFNQYRKTLSSCEVSFLICLLAFRWVGVAATAESRALGDVGGDTFLVQFDITDNRPLAHTPMVCDPPPGARALRGFTG